MKKTIIANIPLFIVLLIWCVFSLPYFFKGTVPYPSTYQVEHFTPWSSYDALHGPVKNGAMPDIIGQIYPWRKLAIDIWKSGQIPLWNPYSFSGTPLLANYQSAVLSPMNLLFLIFSFTNAWRLLILFQPLFAGLFMYIYMRSLKISKTGSALASISFMFCGFITCWMGYGTLGYSIAFLPLALFCLEKYLQTKKILYLTLLSVVIPVSFFSGHFQISIYFFLYIVFYIVYVYLRTKKIKEFLILLLFALLGFVLSLPQIIPSLEFYSQSFRSTLFQKGEVIPWSYIPTLLSPDFYGNPVTRNDWFGHYAEWNSYLGLIPILFACFSLFSKRRKEILIFGIGGILALLLAFDTPLLDFVITLHLPVLSTSAASRIIVLFSFSCAILSGFGLDIFIEDLKKRNIKKIAIFLGSFGMLFVVLWSIVFLKLFLPADKILIAKSNLKLPTLLYGLFVISSLLFFLKNTKKYLMVLPIIFLLITGFDMYRFTTKWQPDDPKRLVFAAVSSTEFLSQYHGIARGYGDYGAEVSNYYKIPSLEGYDPLYIHRYGQFIASLDKGILSESGRSVVNLAKHGEFTPKVVNLLGVKYIIHKTSDDHASWTFPYWDYPGLKTIFDDKKIQVFQNPFAYPRAFLVGKYIVQTNTQKNLDTVLKQEDNRRVITLEKSPNLSINGNGGLVEFKFYTPNAISLRTSASGNRLLFLSDAYYPGWKAYIDGHQTPILRADFAFRAVEVPQGSHVVEFNYDPQSFRIGLLAAIVGVTFLVGASIKLKNRVK